MSKKIKIIIAVVILIVIGLIFAPDEPPPTESTKTEPAALSGINEQVFNEKVKARLDEFNTGDNGFTLAYTATVKGANAVVDIVISSVETWSYSDETIQKDFINTLGDSMDNIAVQSAYSADDMVGVRTTLYSEGGLKLAERTLFGKVKLY